MAWFSRKDKDVEDDVTPARTASPVPAGREASDEQVKAGEPEFDAEIPLRPQLREIGPAEQQRIVSGLEELRTRGVDVDDLAALGAAYDAAMTDWTGTSKRKREDDEVAREPFVMGIGEHLVRHTDLEWSLVRDAFGTDLAVAGGKDDFVVVPANLVTARWMTGATGWVPGVVGHLVSVREDRREPA